jgi:Domain of unknown function (DUF4190)
VVADGARCSDTKRSQSMTEIQAVPKKRIGLAIASLVCGILGGYASTLSIPSVICGHIALSKIKREPTKYGAKKIAIAGLVLGYLGLVLAIVSGAMHGVLRAQLKDIPRSLVEQQSQTSVPVITDHTVQRDTPNIETSKIEKKEGYQVLLNLLDTDIRSDEMQTWLSQIGAEPTKDTLSEDLYVYAFYSKGVILSFRKEKLYSFMLCSEGYTMTFLEDKSYRQYQGKLPFGLSMFSTRADVEMVLGAPVKSERGIDQRNKMAQAAALLKEQGKTLVFSTFVHYMNGAVIISFNTEYDNMDARIRSITVNRSYSNQASLP